MLSFDIPPLGITRPDTVTLQQRILSMSPQERKRRRINKLTLWYQKKNLGAGRKIKIYNKVVARME